MSSKDIAISSREISAQVVQEGVRVAYVGVPGPPGPPGSNVIEYRSSWGEFVGEWNQFSDYEPGAIVTYPPADNGQPIGTYYAYGDPTPGTPPTDTSAWQVLASPGSQGNTSQNETITKWLYPFNFRGNQNLDWISGATYYGPGALTDSGNEEQTRTGRADVIRYKGALWVCRFTHKSSNTNRPGSSSAIAYWGKLADDGRTIRSGTAAPSDSLGNDGDFYLRTGANPRLYGPKDDGQWPNGYIDLKGETGDPGPAGAITSVSATSIASNLDATVSMSGPSNSRSLQFGIPRGAAGKDALSWAALHFDADGTLRMVVPQACSILLGDNPDGDPYVVTAGNGSHQVYVNNNIVSSTTQLSKGDRVSIVATNVGQFYLVSIPFAG